MQKYKNIISGLLSFIILMFCTFSVIASNHFQLSVGNLKNNSEAPRYSVSKQLGGDDTSPDVRWSNPPKGTKSFVLTCIDKNPIAKNWVHWMILNIPTTIRNIPKGTRYDFLVKNYCIVARNSFGSIGYGGPQPPPATGIHNYVFTIYSLDCTLKDIKNYSNISEATLLGKLKGHILEQAKFTLYYGK